MTNSSPEGWYIVKQPPEQCKIISAESLSLAEGKPADSAEKWTEKWGPFETQQQAIAKRIGLIRAGKCKPA